MQKANHVVADFHVAVGSRSATDGRGKLLESLLPSPITQRTSRHPQRDRGPSVSQPLGALHHAQADLMLRQATVALSAYLQSAAYVAIMAGS